MQNFSFAVFFLNNILSVITKHNLINKLNLSNVETRQIMVQLAWLSRV